MTEKITQAIEKAMENGKLYLTDDVYYNQNRLTEQLRQELRSLDQSRRELEREIVRLECENPNTFSTLHKRMCMLDEDIRTLEMTLFDLWLSDVANNQ